MMVESAYKVGCAVSSFMANKPFKTTLMCCNYAVKYYDSPIYSIAANSTGEKCRKKSPYYTGLCAVGEYENMRKIWFFWKWIWCSFIKVNEWYEQNFSIFPAFFDINPQKFIQISFQSQSAFPLHLFFSFIRLKTLRKRERNQEKETIKLSLFFLQRKIPIHIKFSFWIHIHFSPPQTFRRHKKEIILILLWLLDEEKAFHFPFFKWSCIIPFQ